jgi:cobalamin biosynthesis protein CobD/CbiB
MADEKEETVTRRDAHLLIGLAVTFVMSLLSFIVSLVAITQSSSSPAELPYLGNVQLLHSRFGQASIAQK